MVINGLTNYTPVPTGTDEKWVNDMVGEILKKS
jgi:hypothetical protein